MRNAVVQIKNSVYNIKEDNIRPIEFGKINQMIFQEENRIKNTDPKVLKNETSSHQGMIKYFGLDYAIEFCNNYFRPITTLEKLYLDKLYIYALRTNRLSELRKMGYLNNVLYSKIGANTQVAKNVKTILIDRVVGLIKSNKYDEAIDEILCFDSIFIKNKVKEYNKKDIK